jgi:hypothetical protein
MEMHHPHAHQGPKKLKDYFLEFLMVFLAVTVGFFAENFRDTIEERGIAKQYAEALYNDLLSDTSEIEENIRFLTITKQHVDALAALLATGDIKKESSKIYYHSIDASRFAFFSVNNTALEQLMNSGSLRYFRNKDLVRLIADYEHCLEQTMNRTTIDMYTYSGFQTALKKVLDGKTYIRIRDAVKKNPGAIDSILQVQFPLNGYEKNDINDLVIWVDNREVNLNNRVNDWYKIPIEKAHVLLNALKNEYHYK